MSAFVRAALGVADRSKSRSKQLLRAGLARVFGGLLRWFGYLRLSVRAGGQGRGLIHRHWLDIPTYDGNRNVGHPDVLFTPEGFGGWPYWMAYTPFPPDRRENPSLVVSDDGVRWQTPAGLINPVVPAADAVAAGYGYNSDPNLLLLPDRRTLRLYWRYAGGGREAIVYKESRDGVIWGETVEVLTTAAAASVLSPTVIAESDGTFSMWTVDDREPGPRAVQRRRSRDGIDFGDAIPVSTPIARGGPIPWHIDVIRAAGGHYHAILATRDPYQLLYLESADGVTFDGGTDYLVPNGLSHGQDSHYRSSLVAKPGSDDRFDVWYTNVTGPIWYGEWRIGYWENAPLGRRGQRD